MAGRRRRRTYYAPAPMRATRRSTSPIDAFLGWITSLWRELTDEQRRELVGVGLLTLAAAIVASMLIPQATWLAPVRWLTMSLVGVGWPLVVVGSALAGVLLIHPTASKAVQRIQGVAFVLAGVLVLGLLSLVQEPAGGWLGAQLAGNLSRGLSAPGATIALLAALVLAVVFAFRLRVSQLALAAVGRARPPELRHPKKTPRRAAPRVLRARPSSTSVEEAAARQQNPVEELPPGPDEVHEALEDADQRELEDGDVEPADDERADAENAESAVGIDDDEVPRVVAGPGRRRQLSVWTLPTLGLLTAPRARSRRQQEEVRAGVTAIEAKLTVLGIPGAKVIDVDKGPTVTRYVLTIPDDVAVSKVKKLQEDLSLALAASPLRIEAPIPGRSAIGIEVPAARRETVTLRGVLEAEGFAPQQRALAIGLGSDVAGVAVIGDLAKMPHLLIAGATGQGKSVGVNCLICSLLLQHSPDSLLLVLVDPKRVELMGYAGLPHLAAPVIVETQLAAQALAWAVEEMERRFKVLAVASARNIEVYNQKAAVQGTAAMPYVVVVIDELADLMMTAKREVEDLIVRLAQMARAVGIHLVLATQRPSTDVITGLIKANIPSRIAFTVASGTDSRVILDSVGAEKLMGRGDMLYQPVDGGQIRLQGAYLEDREVDAVVEHWRRQGAPNYLGGLVGGGANAQDAAAARLARQGGGEEG